MKGQNCHGSEKHLDFFFFSYFQYFLFNIDVEVNIYLCNNFPEGYVGFLPIGAIAAIVQSDMPQSARADFLFCVNALKLKPQQFCTSVNDEQ